MGTSRDPVSFRWFRNVNWYLAEGYENVDQCRLYELIIIIIVVTLTLTLTLTQLEPRTSEPSDNWADTVIGLVTLC